MPTTPDAATSSPRPTHSGRGTAGLVCGAACAAALTAVLATTATAGPAPAATSTTATTAAAAPAHATTTDRSDHPGLNRGWSMHNRGWFRDADLDRAADDGR